MLRLRLLFGCLVLASCSGEDPQPTAPETPPPYVDPGGIVTEMPFSLEDGAETLITWFDFQLPSDASIISASHYAWGESYGTDLEIEFPNPELLGQALRESALKKGWLDDGRKTIDTALKLPSLRMHTGIEAERSGIRGSGGEGIEILVKWDHEAGRLYFNTYEPD